MSVATSEIGTFQTWLIWQGCPLLSEKQTSFLVNLRLAASGAKRPFARKQHHIQTIGAGWTHDP
jgi:hypothetical protein